MLGQEMASIVAVLAELDTADASSEMSPEYRPQATRMGAHRLRRHRRNGVVYRTIEIIFGVAIAVAIFGPFVH